jgi:hypothetical protein
MDLYFYFMNTYLIRIALKSKDPTDILSVFNVRFFVPFIAYQMTNFVTSYMYFINFSPSFCYWDIFAVYIDSLGKFSLNFQLLLSGKPTTLYCFH